MDISFEVMKKGYSPTHCFIVYVSTHVHISVNYSNFFDYKSGPSEAIGPKKESTKVLEFYHYTQWHSHLMPGYTIFYNTLYSYSYLYHAGSYVHLLIVVVIRCTARHD